MGRWGDGGEKNLIGATMNNEPSTITSCRKLGISLDSKTSEICGALTAPSVNRDRELLTEDLYSNPK